MKTKNKNYIIGIISVLVLATSISIIVPLISNNNIKHDKNYIVISAKKHNSLGKSNDINKVTQTLVRNLSKVVEYVTNSVIIKQNELKHLILGGTDTEGINHKRSQLSSVNKYSPIGFNRYSKEVYSTIKNSIDKLKNENENINKIINTIKIHPYTYEIYLNNDGLVIPNIDFFTNNKPSSVSLQTNTVSNNLYKIGYDSPSINNVSLTSEEAVFGASAISKSGASLGKAVFKNINFTAKIITFNSSLNEYQFATATTTLDTINSSKIIPAKNKSLNMNSSEFSKTTSPQKNNSLYNETNRIFLTESLSRNYIHLYNNDIHYRVNNFGIANISYNHVYQYKYNKVLYSLLIVFVFPIYPVVIGTSIATTVFVIRYKDKKAKLKNNSAVNPESIPVEDTSANRPITAQSSQKDDEVTKHSDESDKDKTSEDTESSDEDLLTDIFDEEASDPIIEGLIAYRKLWTSEINSCLDKCKNTEEGQKLSEVEINELIVNIEENFNVYSKYMIENDKNISKTLKKTLANDDAEISKKYNDILTYRNKLTGSNSPLIKWRPNAKQERTPKIIRKQEDVTVTPGDTIDSHILIQKKEKEAIEEQFRNIRSRIYRFSTDEGPHYNSNMSFNYRTIEKSIQNLEDDLNAKILDEEYKVYVKAKLQGIKGVALKWKGIRERNLLYIEKKGVRKDTGGLLVKDPEYIFSDGQKYNIENDLDAVFEILG